MLESSYESLIDVCVSAAMSTIRGMNYEQVGQLLDERNSKIEEIIDNIPQVQTLPTEREMGLVQNKSLAEWNLSLEPKIEEAKNILQNTYEEAIKTKERVIELKKQLDTLSEERSLDTLSALLQAAAQTAEDESEAILEQFMKGEIEIDQFLKEYVEKKALSHMRKLKSDKLLTVLRQQQYPQPPTNIQQPKYQPMSSSVPYPLSSSGIYPQAPSKHSFWS